MTEQKSRVVKYPALMKRLCSTYFRDANGRLIREKRVSNLDQSEVNLVYQYDASGAIIGFTYYPYSGTATQYFFGKNARGDVICIYDANGTTVARYNYDAWGACTIAYDNTSIGIANINPIRYRSYYYDAESGWYYLNSRYYDPQVGRFLNVDGIIGANGGIMGYNMFAYCDNNPVMYVDPNGLCKHRSNGYCERCQKEAIISGIQKEELPLIESPEEHGTYPTSEEIFAKIVDWSAEHGALKVERDS